MNVEVTEAERCKQWHRSYSPKVEAQKSTKGRVGNLDLEQIASVHRPCGLNIPPKSPNRTAHLPQTAKKNRNQVKRNSSRNATTTATLKGKVATATEASLPTKRAPTSSTKQTLTTASTTALKCNLISQFSQYSMYVIVSH